MIKERPGMRALETTLASIIALACGAGITRIWDHRPPPPLPEVVRVPGPPRFARTIRASRFMKGNLHTHTTRSDGDASPRDVVRWYQEHGYDFVALTDHNLLSARETEARVSVNPRFTELPGEEVTMHGDNRPVHVNAFCTTRVVRGGDFPHARDAIAYATAEITAQGGVALLNHPNFDWALTEADVVESDGNALLEIASGHPYVHTEGDATRHTHEQLWDAALTAGRDVMGVAVDDVHHLVTDADPEAFPGRGWVGVFASTPRADVLCDALRRGDLYASTGEELQSIAVEGASYAVEPVSTGARVTFIGNGGQVLAKTTSDGRPARYAITGAEGYVRARIESPAGVAWTPAVRVVRD